MDKNLLKGIEYLKKSKYTQAQQSLIKCLKKQPSNFDAIHLLGISYFQGDRHQLALDYFARAYSLKKDVSELNQNYTNALIKLVKFELCLSLLSEMLKSAPSNIILLTNKAIALTMKKDFSSAIELYRLLYELTANTKFILEQAKCEIKLNNQSTALALIKKVTDFSSSNSIANALYIQCLFDLKRHSELVDFFLERHNHFTRDYKLLAVDKVSKSLNFIDKSNISKKYKAFYSVAPYGPMEMLELHIASKHPPVYESMEDIVTYRKNYLEKLNQLERIIGTTNIEGFRPKSHFYLSYHGKNNKEINEQLSSLFPVSINNKLSVSQGTQKKLLVISDRLIDGHTITKLNLSLLSYLAKGAFSVTVMIPSDSTSPQIKWLKKAIKDVKVVPESFDKLLDKIEKIKPDIIYYPEIGMSGLLYSLANQRLAPIQFTSWGHPETTGVQNIDYFVTSSILEPEECEQHYSEKLIKLSKLPTIYTEVSLEGSLSPQLNHLVSDTKYITCLQSTFKFHPEFDEIIRNILEQNLHIKLYILDSESVELLMDRFAGNGIDLSRIVVLPKMNNSDFLRFYQCSVLALDPIHFGGGNTVYEAMSLGVPIVTLPGEFMRGRVTSGAYKQMGLKSLIANSKEEYVSLVSRLIQDEEFYRGVKNEILLNKKFLFNTEDVAIELENKLLGLINNVE